MDKRRIRSKNKGGSDDPRNGLALCALHHRALDRDSFSIKPDTLEIFYRADFSARIPSINNVNLNHLRKKPHRDALE